MRKLTFMMLLLAVGANSAAAGAEHNLNSRGGDLGSALNRIAIQAGVEILFLPDVVAGRRAPPLEGQFDIEDALARLLAGTGLSARATHGGAYIVESDRMARRRATAAAALPAATGAATPQPIAGPPDRTEIVVTGTRLRRDGMQLPVPVTVLSRGELAQMAPGGTIDALDLIPQLVANETPATAGNLATPAGASVLNLRGIGSNRTLVLLDGRRVVPSSRLSVIDINVLPEVLVSGVEAVTGGASAAYGSDAVSGVINFRLDTDFTGVVAQLQHGASSRGDYANDKMELAAGVAFGERVHLIASFDRFSSEAIDGYAKRDWYQGWGHVSNPAWPFRGTMLLTRPNVGATGYTFGGLIDAPGSALHRMMFQSDGSVTPFVPGEVAAIEGGTRSQSGGTVQNLEAVAGMLLPDVVRDSVFGHLKFEVGDRLQLFLQGLHGGNRVRNRSNGAVQFGTWAGTIYRDNAYLPESVRATMLAEGRESFTLQRLASPADLCCGELTLTNDTTALTAGFLLTLDAWRIDGYYQYGRNDNQLRLHRYPRTDRLFQAMDAVRDSASGAIVCNVSLRSPTDPRWQGCVPANLLGAGRISPQALAYILDPEHDKTIDARVAQHFTEVTVNRDLDHRWSAEPIGLAFGASYREDTIVQRVWELPGIAQLGTPHNDPARGIRGIPVGYAGETTVHQFSGASAIDGGFRVTELFAETLVPLHSRIDASAALRWARYSGSGSVWAWKLGLDWQVSPGLRLRATRSRDTRAANLTERFDAQAQGTYVLDPRFGYAGYSLSQIIGGNPAVHPERGDTVTAGFVLRPVLLPGLAFSADWLDVRISDAIDLLGAQTIVNGCFAGSASLCAQITRDPVTEELLEIRNVYLNVARSRVRGIDFEASYETTHRLLGGGAERLRFRLLANHLLENSSTPEGGVRIDLAGGVTRPDWTLIANLGYRNGPWQGFLQSRYVSGTQRFPEWRRGIEIDDNQVAGAVYLDARVARSWEVRSGASIEAFLHGSNLLDQDPPVVPSFHEFVGVRQAEKHTFDVIGRQFVVGVRFGY
ncbi:MAG: TonB-dependent receptor [Gammaproteobacteria bacterium]|nr:TonB-dependent receptor [Gammaproteobacteria bacterium]